MKEQQVQEQGIKDRKKSNFDRVLARTRAQSQTFHVPSFIWTLEYLHWDGSDYSQFTDEEVPPAKERWDWLQLRVFDLKDQPLDKF